MRNGVLSMQPNFKKITNKKLIKYILARREELEQLRVLYDRRTPDDKATIYPAPCAPDGMPIEENIKIMKKAIRERIAAQENLRM